MAGNDDRNGVAPVCSTDGTRLALVTHLFGLLAITHRRAKRNRPQRRPRRLLELSSGRIKREVEVLTMAVEVLAELRHGIRQHGMIFTGFHVAERHPLRVVGGPEHSADSCIRRDDRELPNRAAHRG